MNKVILLGNLTQDPEVRYIPSGHAVATFSIGVNSGFGDNKRTDFISIVVWRKLAEICGNNITKGSRVLVEGSLHIRSYETQEKQKRYVTEVVATNVEFLGGNKNVVGSSVSTGSSTGSTKSGDDDVNSFGTDVSDEEIPF